MRKTKDEIEEFDCLDIFGGVDGIVDEDLFDDEVVDEGNMFDWGGLWLLVLYGSIPCNPCMFQLYITIILCSKHEILKQI